MSTILLGFAEDELPENERAEIQALASNLRLLVTTDQAEIEKALAEIEIAVNQFPHELLAKAPKLRWFQQWAAGADWLRQYPDVAESDLIVTSGSGIHAIPISEQILAYLFAFARGLPRTMRAQTRHEWQSIEHNDVFELPDKTMVLVGVGAIGEYTAKIANALGMKVIGVKRDPEVEVPGIERMVSNDQLLDVLPQADVVVLTIPLTSETECLFNEEVFAAMKPTAYLINIGRGGTVDEPALIRALLAGRLAGAGLDVFVEEPLPADSPLWDMKNVLITPHSAGATPHYHERAMAIFLDNLRRYVAGEPLQNVVDKTLGY